MRCPCRKKSETVAYSECCERYHSGERSPPTAEALMRSRYAAFALQDAAYLLATWHSSTRPGRLDLNDGQEWLSLRIVNARTQDNEAIVEFIARSRTAGRSQVLREVSRFIREDQRWYYVDGDIL